MDAWHAAEHCSTFCVHLGADTYLTVLSVRSLHCNCVDVKEMRCRAGCKLN